ncbi:hypothetical protein B0H66DRAFT_643453 [Apodospora peruviana]|uniref:Fungal N-terminal domain-containing protein n=1 Tax=Apodospora peruviana TaxID=516989 RepID=A0AAE0HWQ6_9PEZI|nr:hypothetical protein B0H66DRAFT_643453 [Apodospora peruviana]
MDPFSITAGCVGIMASIERTFVAIRDFVRDVREARGELSTTTRHLSELKMTISLINNGHTPDPAASSAPTPVPESITLQTVTVIGSCRDIIGELDVLMDKYSPRCHRTPLKWALTGKNDVSSLNKQLEAHARTLAMVLEISTLAVSKSIKADTRALGVISDRIDIIERYLGSLTGYTESVVDDTLGPTDEASFETSSVESMSTIDDVAVLSHTSSSPALFSRDSGNLLVNTPNILAIHAKIRQWLHGVIAFWYDDLKASEEAVAAPRKKITAVKEKLSVVTETIIVSRNGLALLYNGRTTRRWARIIRQRRANIANHVEEKAELDRIRATFQTYCEEINAERDRRNLAGWIRGIKTVVSKSGAIEKDAAAGLNVEQL